MASFTYPQLPLGTIRSAYYVHPHTVLLYANGLFLFSIKAKPALLINIELDGYCSPKSMYT